MWFIGVSYAPFLSGAPTPKQNPDLAFKSARIVDLCGKSREFADIENTVDRGSIVIFDADSGLCLLLQP